MLACCSGQRTTMASVSGSFWLLFACTDLPRLLVRSHHSPTSTDPVLHRLVSQLTIQPFAYPQLLSFHLILLDVFPFVRFFFVLYFVVFKLSIFFTFFIFQFFFFVFKSICINYNLIFIRFLSNFYHGRNKSNHSTDFVLPILKYRSYKKSVFDMPSII